MLCSANIKRDFFNADWKRHPMKFNRLTAHP
uniref:Uncharacterized protein n=1 Tax=Anguilla anguilla TaxID=7936 RepID=A0A0E9PLB7_ANGAN